MAIVVVTPILYWMLTRNGASPTYAAILIGAILIGLLIQFSLGILGVVPRLHSDLSRIQKIDLTGAIVRLIVLVGCAFLFLNAAVAVFVSAMAFLLQFWMLRRYAARMVDLDAPENAEDRTAMKGFIKNQAANAVFFCLQGQITVFLISFFGSRAASVAEVGALGRLAMIFTVLGQLHLNVFVPAFARCQTADQVALALFRHRRRSDGILPRRNRRGGLLSQSVSVRSGGQIRTSPDRTSPHDRGHGDECAHRHALGPERVEGMDRRILALHSSYACDTNSAYSLSRISPT